LPNLLEHQELWRVFQTSFDPCGSLCQGRFVGTASPRTSAAIFQQRRAMARCVRIRGREIVIDRKELLEAFARPQRFIDDPMS
jgi:hypothetical protein